MNEQYVIVRTQDWWIYVGVLVQRNGHEVELRQARNVRDVGRREGISLSRFVRYGASTSTICETMIDYIILLNAVMIIPISTNVWESIVRLEKPNAPQKAHGKKVGWLRWLSRNIFN